MHSPYESPAGTKYTSIPWLKFSMRLLLHRREHLASSQMFSTVKHLALGHEVHSQSSEECNEVDLFEWRKLLSSFNNVKALGIRDGLVEELSLPRISGWGGSFEVVNRVAEAQLSLERQYR